MPRWRSNAIRRRRAAIRAAGYEVCSHGWRWVNFAHMSEDVERDEMRRAVASLERTVGERPYGWYCRYAPSLNTRTSVVEEGGFLYDSDAYNDDLPYWTLVDGKRHLVIPVHARQQRHEVRGRPWLHVGRRLLPLPQGRVRRALPRGKYVAQDDVGRTAHAPGRAPGRAAALERFLDYLLQHDEVWIARRVDIARHWIAHHPGAA